jgi:hypothetical protein
MKKSTLVVLAWMAACAMTGTTYSQDEHGDVEFAYAQGKLAIEFGSETKVPYSKVNFQPTESICNLPRNRVSLRKSKRG